MSDEFKNRLQSLVGSETTDDTPVVKVKKTRKKKAKKTQREKYEEMSHEQLVDLLMEGVKPKVKKPKRPPSAYNVFVKENYEKVKEFPPKERFKELGKLWKLEKERVASEQ